MRLVIVALVGALLVGPALAQAQDYTPAITSPTGSLYVIGRDTAVPVAGRLPPACSGTEVLVALYVRATGQGISGPLEGSVGVTTRVAADGSFSAEVLLVAHVRPEPAQAWPGVTGTCLPDPFYGGHALIGVADIPAGSPTVAAFRIPPKALDFPHGDPRSKWVLEARADGIACTGADIDDRSLRDPDGSLVLRLGGPGQPAACSRDGAAVTFFYPERDLTLFVQGRLVVGVTQPLENLAILPPGDPRVPSAGTGRRGTSPDDADVGAAALGFGCLLVALAAAAVRRRS